MLKEEIERKVSIALQEAIDEEAGISLDVSVEAKRIEREILEKSKEIEKIRNKFNINVRNGKFVTSVFGIKTEIVFSLYYFNNKEIYDRLKGEIGIGGASNFGSRRIVLNMPVISGQIPDFYIGEYLQHELTHYFDEIKMQGQSIPDKEYRLYDFVINFINKGKLLNNEYMVDFGMSLYISFKSEQMALANGLYNILSKTDPSIFDFNNTMEYSYLLKMKNVVENFENYKSFSYWLNITPEKAYRIISDGYKNYNRRLGRVIMKAISEYRKRTKGFVDIFSI